MAHLVLHVTFHMPEVMKLARQIFGAELAPTGRDDSLAGRVALDSLRDGPLGMWLFRDRAALNDLAASVRRAVGSWVLPFLDASNRLTSFAAGPAHDHVTAQIVAASYVCMGQQRAAVDYLRGHAENETDAQSTLLTPQAREGERRRRAEAVAVLERYLTTDALDQ